MPDKNAVPLDRGWLILIHDIGARPEDVLRRAGLPEDLFSRENAKLSIDEYFGLWKGLEAEAGDALLPLRLGQAVRYDNVEKSIIYAKFMSPGHMLMTNKQVFDDLASNMTRYSLAPTWMNLTKLMAGAVVGSFKHKDF